MARRVGCDCIDYYCYGRYLTMVKIRNIIFWQTPIGWKVDEYRDKLFPAFIYIDVYRRDFREPNYDTKEPVYVPNFKHRDYKIVLKNYWWRVIKWNLFYFKEGFMHHATIWYSIWERIVI